VTFPSYIAIKIHRTINMRVMLALLVFVAGCTNIEHKDFSNRSVVYTGCHTVETSRGNDGSRALFLFWEIPAGWGWTFFKQQSDDGTVTPVTTGKPC
jgi:hypothetical protein